MAYIRKTFVLIEREKRTDEAAWQNATSWLGGVPHLPEADWPRDPEQGRPMTFLAQIDLSRLPAGPWQRLGLPDGSLAFFMMADLERNEIPCAVRFVAAGVPTKPLTPPEDAPPVYGALWRYFDEGVVDERDAAKIFLRWPVKFARTKLGGSIHNNHINTKNSLSSCMTIKESGDTKTNILLFWDSIERITNEIRNKLNGHRWFPPQQREHQDSDTQHMQSFHDKWKARSHKKYRWDLIDAKTKIEFRNDLDALEKQMHGTKRMYGTGSLAGSITAANADSLRYLMCAEKNLFQRIPDSIRNTLIVERSVSSWRSKSGFTGIHCLFKPYDEDDEEHYLPKKQITLLNLGSDDMLHWLWGDVGSLRFRISEGALRKHAWEQVTLYMT